MAYVKGEPFILQVEDENGDPLVNGTVEFYLSGTSTPTNIYSDTSGVSQGTSLTLDSSGYPVNGSGTRFDPHFDTGIAYKIVRKDASGTAISPTIDPYYGAAGSAGNIAIDAVDSGASDSLYDYTGAYDGQQVSVGGYYTVGDGGGGMFYWDASSTASDDGGGVIVPTGQGATGRWLRNLNGNPPNIVMFGAKADDSSFDSLSAITNALAYVEQGVVEVPTTAGDAETIYYVSDTVYVPHQHVLRGQTRASTRIYAQTVFGGNHVVQLGEGFATDGLTAISGCRVENLTISANEVDNVMGVYSSQINESSGIRDCLVVGWGASACQITTVSGGSQGSPKNFELLQSSFYVNDPDDGVTHCLDITSPQIRGLRDLTLIGDGFDYGTTGTRCASGLRLYGYPSVAIVGLHIEGCEDGVYLEQATGVSIHHVTGGGSASGPIDNLVRIADNSANQNISLEDIDRNSTSVTNLIQDDYIGETIGEGTGEGGADVSVVCKYTVGTGTGDIRTRYCTVPEVEDRLTRVYFRDRIRHRALENGNDFTDPKDPYLVSGYRPLYIFAGDDVYARLPSLTQDSSWTDQEALNVQETSTTTGTGTYSLAGATGSHVTFVAGAGDGAVVRYRVDDGTDFEEGIGTVTDDSPDTLSRTTIVKSSNSDNAVNWGAGTKTITLIPRLYLPDGDAFIFRVLWQGATTCYLFTIEGDGALFDMDGTTVGTTAVSGGGNIRRVSLTANKIYTVVGTYSGTTPRWHITGNTDT